MFTIPQNRFNRSQRSTQQPILPERLQRLNAEVGKSKDFDYLYATRLGVRIRVCVMIDEDGKYFATAQLGDRAYRRQGGSPSGAFWMLTIALSVGLAHMTSAQRETLRNQEVSA